MEDKERRAHPRHEVATTAELTVEGSDKPGRRKIADLMPSSPPPEEAEETQSETEGTPSEVIDTEAAAPEASEQTATGAEAAEPDGAEAGAVEPATAQPEVANDKRSHARVKVAYEINVEAGLQLRGQEVMRLKLVGTTVDISRGGMLIHVEKEVLPGARCDVHFLEAKGKIEPVETWGRVRRSVKARTGFNLAVQFDQPLDKLDV